MKINMLQDKLLVTRLAQETKTPGGLIIPEAARKKSERAKVVAAGPGKFNERAERVPMGVKAGDVVLLQQWAGTEIKLDGEEHLIISEAEVLGVEAREQ